MTAKEFTDAIEQIGIHWNEGFITEEQRDYTISILCKVFVTLNSRPLSVMDARESTKLEDD